MMKEGPAMRALQSCVVIHFDRANSVYSAGETLAGRLELNFLCDLRVRTIKLQFRGHARVSWDEQRAYTKGSAPSVSLKNSEVFLDQNVYILKKGQIIPDVTCDIDGDGCAGTRQSPTKKPQRKGLCFPISAAEGEEGLLLPAGLHRYAFELILPRHLPSSFEGRWGQIVYGVKMTLERPWKRDIEVDRNFIVESVIDFNEEPEVLRPIAGSSRFDIGLICCRSRALYVEVRVPRKGFVRGEAIPFYVQLVNDSYVKMRDSRVALVQHAVFRAGCKLKKAVRTIRSISRGEIPSGQTVTWDNETIEVPLDVIPSTSNFDEWKGITIKYTLTVSVTRSLWGEDLVVPIQIVVGTIPLRRDTAQRYLSQFILPPDGANSLPAATTKTDSLGSATRKDSATSLKQDVTSDGKSQPPTKYKQQGRRSVPCFPSLPVPLEPAESGGRRASAFELGASSRAQPGNIRVRDTGDLKKGQTLSSSLGAGLQSKPNQPESDSRRRLISVSEENNEQQSRHENLKN